MKALFSETVSHVDPAALDQLLHPTIDPKAERKVIASGLPAVSKCVHARNLAMGRAKMREKANA